MKYSNVLKKFFFSIYWNILVIFTIFYIGTSVVSYWRGTWTLLDIYVYPIRGDRFSDHVYDEYYNDPYFNYYNFVDDRLEKTLWLCLGLGIGILFIGFIISVPLHYISIYIRKKALLSTRLSVLYKIIWIILWIIEKVFYYIIGFGSVCFWRGIWYFWDRYILSDDLEISAWISHSIGFIALVLVFASKSIIAPPGIGIMDGGSNSFTLDLPYYHKSDPINLSRSILTPCCSCLEIKHKNEKQLRKHNNERQLENIV